MHFIPGLRLRCDEETEILGVDDAQLGEFAYDYVGLDAELGVKGMGHNFSGPGGIGEPAPHGAVGGGREPMHSHSHVAKASKSEGSESEHEKV